jgi:hypothetical protein
MPITAANSGAVDTLRQRVLDFLAQRRSQGEYRVIDVGGRYNPWADEHADAYVDLFPTDASGKKIFVGNICEADVWQEIRESGQRFDFSICTHVLEDIRDPFFVARQLASISRAGYVSVPTKHSEMANVESKFYLGYCHHRWVYTVRELDGEPKMLALAKMPVLGYFNNRLRPMLKLIHFFGRWTIMAKVERRLGIFPGGGTVDWVDKSLVGHHTELGVWWDESLPIEAILDDYSGETCLELADLYRDQLRNGI